MPQVKPAAAAKATTPAAPAIPPSPPEGSATTSDLGTAVPSASAAAVRAFGPGEVRLDTCLARQGKRTLKGTACKTGFAIYGPYITIPEGSEIEVSFELRAETALSVATDMVSGMGKAFHAGVNEQVVESGTRRVIGYRVRMGGQAEAFESRVFIKAADPGETSTFTINDFSLTVRPSAS